MNQIVSLFMFSCGDYEKVKQDVWEENWKAMRLYSVVALVAFGVIALVSVFSLSIGKFKWVYLVYTFLSLAYFCISRCQLRSFLGKELVVYSFFAALLLFGIITGKLGGSVSALTTYTLLSNILAAVAVPLLFPLVEPHADLSFFTAFLKILSKVFPLLLCPFFAAWLIRLYLPKIHQWLLNMHDLAFYLWAVALTIVTAQTFKSLVESDTPASVKILIALAGLFACAVQFLLGKKIGTHYHDRISAGQALGQKNTVLAIWMAYTYLDPVSSLAPGSYVLWQNIINSYQLWKKRKKEGK